MQQPVWLGESGHWGIAYRYNKRELKWNTVSRPKILILGLLLLAVAAYFALDLGPYLSLSAIKQSQASFVVWYDQRPVLVTLVFFLVYVAITALSLPGAGIMTLASGASFGLVWGTVMVSLASTVGATLAMLAARTVLREVLEKRFAGKLAEVNRGLDKEGALYLFTLRMIPAVPFVVLNLLMGLTRIKTWTFFWVSQAGMFAGTAAYVYVGTEIARIDSLASILSPGLIGALVLLGILPLLTRKIMDAIRRRRN